MVDGALTLELRETLSKGLQAAASQAHQGVQEFVEGVLEDALSVEVADEDWAEDERRWAEFERTANRFRQQLPSPT
jgi:hypothetical protein